MSVTATFSTDNVDTAAMFTPPGASEPLLLAYIPTNAAITIGGQTYTIDESGVKTDIVLFDQTTPLDEFIPDMKGHYGVGMIQGAAPGGSDSGFIADFLSATNKITENGGIVPTTFTDYQGSGFTPGPGIPSGCTNHAVITCTSFGVAPIPLIGSDGKSYDLIFGTWHDDSFYNLPGTNDTTVAANVSFAAVSDVSDAPEPSAAYMAFVGLGLLAAGAGVKKRLS
jgi:hypothetical protein